MQKKGDFLRYFARRTCSGNSPQVLANRIWLPANCSWEHIPPHLHTHTAYANRTLGNSIASTLLGSSPPPGNTQREKHLSREDMGRYPLKPNIERTPMLRMKSHKHTNKRHSLSQFCSQPTQDVCASSNPGVRMLCLCLHQISDTWWRPYFCHVFAFIVCSEVNVYVVHCFIRKFCWNLYFLNFTEQLLHWAQRLSIKRKLPKSYT